MKDENWLDTVVGGSELDHLIAVVQAFKKLEYSFKSDWTGLCPFFRADALVLQATAEATANTKIASSLTGPILELKKLQIQADVQKAYANKWQGGVPTTILPGQVQGQLLDIRGGLHPSAATEAATK